MSLTADEISAMERRLVGAIWFVFLIGTATIATAWFFELVWHYQPCALCLYQRVPYYAGLLLAALGLVFAVFGAPLILLRVLLVLIGLVFLTGLSLGAYHAGVEWHLWAGPAQCGATAATGPASASDLLASIQTTRIVSCTDAAWRFLGISMAGWNALVSALLAGVALAAAARRD